MPRSTSPALLARAEKAGLIDRADDGGKVIHDWPIYNSATIGEKVAYYLAQHPGASANEVHKAIGGTRELVLSEVSKQRPPGSEGGTAEPPNPGTGRTTSEGGSGGSENGTHARGPVPSRPLEEQPKAVALDLDDEPDIGTSTAQGRKLETITPALREIP